MFTLHKSIQLTGGKISARLKKHNSSTLHDLYCTYLHAISKITFTYSTALFKIILQTNHCMQDTNSQHLKSPICSKSTLSNENCDHAELHNHGCYGKVCFVLIHIVFISSKLLAEIGDWE